jgi:hypothetical protein
MVGIATVFGLIGSFVTFCVISIRLHYESDLLVECPHAINVGVSRHKGEMSIFAVKIHPPPRIPAGTEYSWARRLPMRSLSMAGFRFEVGQRATFMSSSATTESIDDYDSIMEINFPGWAMIFTGLLYFPVRTFLRRGFVGRGFPVLPKSSVKKGENYT